MSTVTRDITTEQAVRTCLERAARPMSPHQICAWVLDTFALPMQHNTCAKDMHFLRKKGVDIQKQEQGGHFEYFIGGGGVAGQNMDTRDDRPVSHLSAPSRIGEVAVDSAVPRHVYRQTFDQVCQCGKSYWIKDGLCTVCKQERVVEVEKHS